MIDGYIKNAEEVETVSLYYLLPQNNKWHEMIDTTNAINGQFSFKGYIDELTGAYIKIDGTPIRIYLEPTRIKLTVDKTQPYIYELSGTSVDKENNELTAELLNNRKLCYEKYNYINYLTEQIELQNDNLIKDSLIDVLNHNISEYQVVDREIFTTIYLDFVLKHNDYKIIPDLLYQIGDKGMVGMDTIKSLYNNLPEKTKNGMSGKLVFEQISWMNYKKKSFVGGNAPDIKGIDIFGNTIKLSEFKDRNYVLIDFWASWCSPCLKGIPKLEQINNDYREKGLEIIGVSLDTDSIAWLDAIDKYQIKTKWPQLLHPQFADRILFNKDNISEVYNIEYIPLYILIDKQGKIIARWQHIGDDEFSFIAHTLSEK